ncbi:MULTISPECIES: DUF4347 domain-containing protein [Nostoc]|uniref:DUF4347 domain-containing protein n=1 Tax=Nostoc paludosum FACHB-159 TaxID=2692908 RepID=A0ABR8KHG1_9NOSO|nr:MULTISPECIES: DUF4347 domain-containing protein [Nostoc]MBD2681053.1 DUF4347 domain-containing protein [Nostoc sp. FACHB-857]MBD2737527.1 DUF4347 domain-containing protein [Nostoc paludosum FACHB-159]
MTTTHQTAIVFVNDNLDESSINLLKNTVQDNTKIITLNSNADGIAQITESLKQYSQIESIQIFSHGSEGSLQLGNTELNTTNINEYSQQLQSWSKALTEDGDILLLGCNVATGEQGKRFVEKFSELTGTDIAASDDLTGNTEFGGDWELEYTTGLIEAPLAFQIEVLKAYTGVLGQIHVKNTNDSGIDSLRQAISLANSTAGGDEIIFDITGTITLSSALPAITDDLKIDGDNKITINGNQQQILTVGNGADVTISDLTLTNGLAKGSDGASGGGGGLGAGGALFINNNSSVLVNNVTFTNNQARGGNGTTGASGGADERSGSSGGSGGRLNISGSDYYNSISNTGAGGGGGGLQQGGGNGGSGGFGAGGGAGGGGGGGDNGNDVAGNGGVGGSGGFGAGGGAGGGGGHDYDRVGANEEGSGGAGGAGGEFAGGGSGGYGAGGSGGVGGGGAGLGGAIFVNNGSNLTLIGGSFNNNTVIGGTGANNGQGLGSAVFVRDGATLNTLDVTLNGNTIYGSNTSLPRPTVSITPISITPSEQGLVAAQFKVSLSTAIPADLTVNYTLTGSATANKDYTPSSSIVILANTTNATISIPVLEDKFFDPNETIVVTLASGNFYNINSSQSKATQTIIDNEPKVISVTGLQTVEGGTNGQFTITLDRPAPVNGLNVRYKIGNGSAVFKEDYKLFITDQLNPGQEIELLNSAGFITIPAGSTTFNVKVVPINDRILEPTETIILEIVENQQNGELQDYGIEPGKGQSSINILDNEIEPTISVKAGNQPSENNSNLGTFEFTVKYLDQNGNLLSNNDPRIPEYYIDKNSNLSRDIVIEYDLNGSAIRGADYPLVKLESPIRNDEYKSILKKTVAITPENDFIDEDVETINLNLKEAIPSRPYYNINNVESNAILSIEDNDTAGVVISPVSGNTSEQGDQATFTVRLASQPTSPVTINFSSSQPNEGNTTVNSITLDSNNWNQLQTITIQGVDDTIPDDNQTYTIQTSITTSDPKYQVIDPQDITLINFDDDKPNILIRQSDGSTKVSEGGITDSYTLVLTQKPSEIVEITVNPESQIDLGAGAGVPIVLTFTPTNFNTPQTVTLKANDDLDLEFTHRSVISHAVRSSDSGYRQLPVGNVNVEIEDNEKITVNVKAIGNGSEESGIPGIIDFILDRAAPSQGFKINYTITGAHPISANAATPGVDFLPLTGSIQVDPGATGATLNITPIFDILSELPSEDVTISIAAGDGYIAGQSNTATIQITDDDVPGLRIIQSGTTTEVVEGGLTDTYQIYLLSQPTADVTVSFSTSPNGQLDQISPITFTPENWKQPQTVTVTAIDDGKLETANQNKATIQHSVSSSDPTYNTGTVINGQPIATISVKISDPILDAGEVANVFDQSLSFLEDSFNNGFFKTDLPIFGSPGNLGIDFIKSFKDGLVNVIRGDAQLTPEKLKKLLERELGSKDFELKNVNIKADQEEVYFGFTLTDTYKFLDEPIKADLGFPVLGVKVDGRFQSEFTWRLDLGLGWNKKFGYFIDTENTAIKGKLNLGVDPNFAAQGNLGFLRLDLKNNNLSPTEGRIEFDLGFNDVDNYDSVKFLDVDGDGKLNGIDPFVVINKFGNSPTITGEDQGKTYQGVGVQYADLNDNSVLDADEPYVVSKFDPTFAVSGLGLEGLTKNALFNNGIDGQGKFNPNLGKLDLDGNGEFDRYIDLDNDNAYDPGEPYSPDATGETFTIEESNLKWDTSVQRGTVQFIDLNQNGRYNQNEPFVVNQGEVRFIALNANQERDKIISIDEPVSYQNNEFVTIPGAIPSNTKIRTYYTDGSYLTFNEIKQALLQKKGKDLLNLYFNADVNLGLKAKTSVLGNSSFPSVLFDFAANFPVLNYQDGELTGRKAPEVAFNNIQLDAGTFASNFAKPIVEKVDKLIEPIRPVIKLLQADTKIFSKLGLASVFDRDGDDKVSVLEVAEFLKRLESFGNSSGIGTKFFNAIVRFDRLLDTIKEISQQPQGQPILIDLGSYKLLDSIDVTDPDDVSKEKKTEPTKKASSADDQLKGTTNSASVKVVKGFTGNPDFNVPLLTNPTTVVDLLLGKDVPLFTFDLPPLVFDFSVSKEFPVFWPVSGLLGGGFSVAADLAFGYDTYGFRQWSLKDFAPLQAWRVFDGFYVSDRANADGTGEDVNELTARAYIEAGAGLNFVVISGYVKGGLEGLLGVDLIDGGELNGTSDGRIRPSEIARRLSSPWELFQLSGALNVFVAAEVRSFGATVWEKRLATFNLASFSVGPKGNSAGTAFDADIAAAYVFFDANLNGVLDPTEPYTISNADGTYSLDIALAQFDANGNGKIDATEGNIIVVDGIDTSTDITQTTPLITTPEATVASPLTTLAAKIAELKLDSAATQVKQVLGLPATFNLFEYKFSDLDITTLSKLGQLQNLLIYATSEIATATATQEPQTIAAIANEVLEAIVTRVNNNTAFNLSDKATVKVILQEVVSSRNIVLDATQVEAIASQISGDNQTIITVTNNTQLTAEEQRQQIIAEIAPAELAGGFQSLALKPLSALTQLVADTLDTVGAQSQVKAAFGLPTIDIFNFDPFAEIANGDPLGNGLIVFAKQTVVQNTIVVLTQFLSGHLGIDVSKVSYQVIDALIEPIKNSQSVDLSNVSFLAAIIQTLAPNLAAEDINGVTEILAQANQILTTIASNTSLSLLEKTTQITQVQKVIQGEVAADLKAVGTGTKPISEALTENTGNALTNQITAAEVSNPAFKTDDNTLTAITPQGTQLQLKVLNKPENTSFAVTKIFTSKNGTATLNQDGTITYVPNSGFVGEDSFFYVASNGTELINGSVNVTVYTSFANQAGKTRIYTGPDDDYITTGNADDFIKDAGGKNYIDAGEGNNVIYGGAEDSEIHTGNGNDFIQLLAGNNVIFAGDGLNNITTGAGDDKVTSGSGDDVINAGEGDNIIHAGDGNNLITTDDGDDQIITGKGDDFIGAGDGNNIIRAGDGTNVIATGAGEDKIYTGSGKDIINSGAGNDVVRTGAENDDINGGDGDDSIFAGDGDDIIAPGAGDNRVFTGLGKDTITLEVGKGVTKIYQFEAGVDQIQVSEELQEQLTFTQGTEKEANKTFVKVGEQLIAVIYERNNIKVEIAPQDQKLLSNDSQTPALVIDELTTQYFEDEVAEPIVSFDEKDLKKRSLKDLTATDIINFKVMPNPEQTNENLQQKIQEGIKQKPVKVIIKLPDGLEDITVNTILQRRADGSLYDFRRLSNGQRGLLDEELLTGAILQDRNLDGKPDWAVVYLQDGEWGDEDGLSNGEIASSLVLANWDLGTSRMEVRSGQDGFNFHGNRSFVQFSLNRFSGVEASEVGLARVRFGDSGEIIEVNGKAVGSLEEAKQAIISFGETLFGTLANKNPNPGFGTQTRTIAFEEGEQVVFFAIQGGTKEDLLTNGLNSKPVQFSLPSLNNGATILTANSDAAGQIAKFSVASLFDIDAKILTAQELQPQLAQLATSHKTGKLIDLKSSGAFDEKQVVLEFSVQREAAFNNCAYLYRVDDAKGSIKDPLTNMLLDPTVNLNDEQKQRYLQLATSENLVKDVQFSTGNFASTIFGASLQGGEYYVPFLISDGTLSSIGNDLSRVLTPYIGINSDRLDHIRSLGNNSYGFEDIVSGGDRDYNDMILSINKVQFQG